MRTIVILWTVLFAIIGCGNDDYHNSSPVIDYLIIPEEASPGASVELQVVARDADDDTLIYVWDVEKGKLNSRTGQIVEWTVPSDLKMAVVTVAVNDGVNEPITQSKRVPIRLQNSAPLIGEIIVPVQVHAISSVPLQAAVHDANGDTLAYSWTVKMGVLDSETIPTPTWTAPIDTGLVTITLTVDDGVNEPVMESVVVQIIHALIVPGERAAGIKLGDSFDRVRTLYGRPSKRNSDFFAYWDPDIGLSGVLDGIGLVESLSIRVPNKAKTVEGIGIGNTLKGVEEEFGRAEKIEEGGKVHWYWTKGIEFSYDADAKVTSISIFKPIGAAPAGFDDALQRE